ncbi:cupin domain-containing protein [Pandoraea fibrosis]|uniref:Cupin domain-containing protein n=1 Tax=Pandoraea fibrosis TaxID=1891094 RepID=A0A5E4SH59_9BURK|nr:cupin domain-containing protein [Pandoraea fibrosis]QHE92414.1 cupin domain-containing protein [Pandoraea fibrosis]QHF14029.1 cupin domain-containing protein [Pandoraea fibrosis]VVD73784.1 hypothetical protein PFI31113_00748 [Pandoraea fibrosis]
MHLLTSTTRVLRPSCPHRQRRLGHLFGAVALSIAAVASPSAIADNAHRADVSTETLVKSTTAWDQTRYTAYPSGTPEPTLVRITLAPNTRLDWHTHPMPAIGYVASGQITVERADNGARHSFVAGQTVMELVDVPHRGWTGETGAELLVFYARSVHQPLAVASPNADKLAQDDAVQTPLD